MRLALGLATVWFFWGQPLFAKLETWRTEGASSLAKGKRDRVVLSDAGKLRLGYSLKPIGTLDATRVWDLARDSKGNLFAATGDEGRVFRRDGKEDAPWSLAFDAADTQALALGVGPEGHIFVGTGPSGQVVDVTDPKHPRSRPSPAVQYIWDLAADAKGNLYAATGPTGQLWKRSAESGAWNLVFDSKHDHLLCVAVADDGTIYAGSDGEGLIYKIGPGGKVSVLYDATQSEIRSLLIALDGTVYAGTASDSGGGGGRGPGSFPGGGLTSNLGVTSEVKYASTASAPLQEPLKKPRGEPRNAPPAGGSAIPRPFTAGDNAVYRISTDGVVREIFRAKAMIFALAISGDRLLVGTGPEGVVYEIRDQGRESSPVARLDNGHVLALLAGPDGEVLLGTGDPGSVVRLEKEHVSEGVFHSEIRDTKIISKFGAVNWRAECPKGTSVTLQVHSGNVAEPDSTWSEWSPEQTDPESSQSQVAPGRFVQYRAKLTTKDPKESPELSAITLRYQTANLAPEIAKIEVPDLSALDGATRQTRLTFKWEVSDPNDDDLSFTLSLRKEGWPSWVKITEAPLTEKTFAWDASTVPPGRYQIRLVATDRPSNNAGDAIDRERISDPFIIDSQPPIVSIKEGAGGASATLKDGLTRVAKASYAINGGEWVPVFADDGLFDSLSETVSIPLPELKSGTHVLMVRATDAAGNTGAGDLLIKIP